MAVTHGSASAGKGGAAGSGGVAKNSPGSSAWSVYLLQITTGNIGPRVDVESGSWAIPLNGVETFKARVRKSSLPVDLNSIWFSPWWAGLLLCYNDTPIFAGPLISEPSEDFHYLDLDCAGIRAILAKRTVIPELVNMANLASTTVSYTGMSLATIAMYCVQNAMIKPGGALPITFPVATETGLPSDSDHQRTYDGFDVSNLFCNDVLTKISDVHNGPDFMFKPRKASDGKLVWDMWSGNSLSPRIPQSKTVVWDTTTVGGPVVNLQLVATGAYMTNRVYSLGNGQNQGRVITISENVSKMTQGYPFLETAISTSNSQDPNVVKAAGDGDLHQNLDLIRDIQITVRADGFDQLGSYWSGDFMDLVTKGWRSLSDGKHGCRLITISGDLTSNVKLSLQTEFDYEGS